MVEEVSKRKVRSDKKRDIKPTVPVHVSDCVSDIAYITNRPVKDIVEFVCIEGVRSTKVVEYLSQYFKRDYWHNNTMFKGNGASGHSRYIIRKRNSSVRVSTRFTNDFYNSIERLADASGFTPASITGLLLESAIKDTDIINKCLSVHTSNLDDNRKKVLKDVLRYVNKDNPYREQINFMDLIKYLIEDIKMWTKKESTL